MSRRFLRAMQFQLNARRSGTLIRRAMRRIGRPTRPTRVSRLHRPWRRRDGPNALRLSQSRSDSGLPKVRWLHRPVQVRKAGVMCPRDSGLACLPPMRHPARLTTLLPPLLQVVKGLARLVAGRHWLGRCGLRDWQSLLKHWHSQWRPTVTGSENAAVAEVAVAS